MTTICCLSSGSNLCQWGSNPDWWLSLTENLPVLTMFGFHQVKSPNIFPILYIDGILTYCIDIFFDTMRYDCNNLSNGQANSTHQAGNRSFLETCFRQYNECILKCKFQNRGSIWVPIKTNVVLKIKIIGISGICTTTYNMFYIIILWIREKGGRVSD